MCCLDCPRLGERRWLWKAGGAESGELGVAVVVTELEIVDVGMAGIFGGESVGAEIA